MYFIISAFMCADISLNHMKNLTLENWVFPFLVSDIILRVSYVFSMFLLFLNCISITVLGIILIHNVSSRVRFISFWPSCLMIFHLSTRRSAAREHNSTHLKIGVKVEMKPVQSQTVLLKTGRHLNLHKKDKYLCWS